MALGGFKLTTMLDSTSRPGWSAIINTRQPDLTGVCAITETFERVRLGIEGGGDVRAGIDVLHAGGQPGRQGPVARSGDVQVGIVLDVRFRQADPGDSRHFQEERKVDEVLRMQAADGQFVIIVLVAGLEAARDQRKGVGVLGEAELGGLRSGCAVPSGKAARAPRSGRPRRHRKRGLRSPGAGRRRPSPPSAP